MTEIKLMNYGRGAGKTHTIQKWQLQDQKNRFIVCSPENVGNFPYVKGSRLYTYKEYASYDGMRGLNIAEVAFDDLDLTDDIHLAIFTRIMGYRPRTVILATSVAAMETEAVAGDLIKEAKFAGSPVIDKMNEAMSKVSEGEPEPIQSVKARDLRIGDWVVGKGHVFSLSEADSYIGSLFKVYIEDKALGFEGELKVLPDTLLDVDITKRK